MVNTFSDVVPRLLAQALPVLRANSIMPRIVNRDYDSVAAQQGDVINVPISPTIATNAVAPGATPPATADTTEATAPVNLNQWQEAPFYMTDKEQREVMAGSIPAKAAAAVAALSDFVDVRILEAISRGSTLAIGTAATTPFATLALAQGPNTNLNNAKAQRADRHVVFNADAEANLIALATFADSNFVGDVGAMTEAEFGAKNRRLNANWWMNQNVFTHTKGTGTSYLSNLVAGYAIGDTSIAIDTGSGTVVAGDVVTFTGDTNKYIVATGVAAPGTIVLAGTGLRQTLANNVAMTIGADHVANCAFQKQAVVFASRALQSSAANVNVQSVTDPLTGLTLRLEITREHKRDRWSFDVLFGADVVEGATVFKILG